MAQYLLVQNKQIVHLGPFDWKQRYIQSEFDDLHDQGEISFQYQVPPIEPGYVDVGEGFEIFPIVGTEMPDMDLTFEEPVGPFYTYEDNQAFATYHKQDRSLGHIQGSLIEVAVRLRNTKENAGTTVKVTSGEINVPTDKDSRIHFSTLLSSMGTNSINYKLGSDFVPLTSTDMQTIVNTVHDYVQAQFDWELTIATEINNTPDIDKLKEIYTSLVPVLQPRVGVPNAS